VQSLMSAEWGTVEGDRLDVLAILVEAYETRHFPLGFTDPVEAIKFCMDQKGLTPKDLVPMIGALSRVDDVLNGIRPLTLAMIRRLHQGLGIPVESLIQPCRSKTATTV
jgi:HTH-type transcriptional regulator/antitoxin HigA